MSRATSPPPSPSSLPHALLPQNLDTLPHVTTLLLRLQAHINARSSNPSNTPPSQPSIASADVVPLSPKEFSVTCDELRQRLRRARAAVHELDGTDVTVEEQEVELKLLEEKVEAQRSALRELKTRGKKVVESLNNGIDPDGNMDLS